MGFAWLRLFRLIFGCALWNLSFLNLTYVLGDKDPLVLQTAPLEYFQDTTVFVKVREPKSVSYVFRLKPAKDFGGLLESTYPNILLVPAYPEDGCSAYANRWKTKNNIALVKRGQCSFMSKALVAQQAGAVAVVVTDSEQDNDEKYIDMIHDETNREASIPSFFMLGKDGYMIKQALKEAGLHAAEISIPFNVTGIPLHELRQPPWTYW